MQQLLIHMRADARGCRPELCWMYPVLQVQVEPAHLCGAALGSSHLAPGYSSTCCLGFTWSATACFHTPSLFMMLKMMNRVFYFWGHPKAFSAGKCPHGWDLRHVACADERSGWGCTALGSHHWKRHKIIWAISFYLLRLYPITPIIINIPWILSTFLTGLYNEHASVHCRCLWYFSNPTGISSPDLRQHFLCCFFFFS